MVILLILGLFSLTAGIQARNIAFHKQGAAQAQALAETGVWVGKALVETDLLQGVQLITANCQPRTYGPYQYPVANFTTANPAEVSNGTYKYTLSDGGPSNDPWLRLVQVVAVGTTSSGQITTIIARLRPANFCKYAYFEQYEMTNGWMINGMNYTGPVYSDDTGGMNIYWDQSLNNPIFTSTVSSAANHVNWYSSSNTPQTPAQWSGVFALGQSALTLNAPNIAFPPSSVNQQYKAWDGGNGILVDPTGKTAPTAPSPPFPSTASSVSSEVTVTNNQTGGNGKTVTGIIPTTQHPYVAPAVYLNSNGNTGTADAGIYINTKDPINNLVFSVDSNGRQVISITQTIPPELAQDASNNYYVVSGTGQENTTQITVDLAANKTYLQLIPNVDTTPPSQLPALVTLNGVPNGLIYSTSTINGLHGTIANNIVSNDVATVRNSWTVTTNVTNSDINIDGNLIYATQPNPMLSGSATQNLYPGTLGLYAQNIVLNNDTLNGTMSKYIDPAQVNDASTINTIQNVVEKNSNGQIVYDSNGIPIMTTDGRNLPLCQDRVEQAMVMAGGNSSNGLWEADPNGESDGYTGWTYLHNGSAGYMNETGGIINYQAGCFGYFNPGNGQMVSGYAEHYTYDTRMDGFPPPFFPTTLTFTVDSWEVQ